MYDYRTVNGIDYFTEDNWKTFKAGLKLEKDMLKDVVEIIRESIDYMLNNSKYDKECVIYNLKKLLDCTQAISVDDIRYQEKIDILHDYFTKEPEGWKPYVV